MDGEAGMDLENKNRLGQEECIKIGGMGQLGRDRQAMSKTTKSYISPLRALARVKIPSGLHVAQWFPARYRLHLGLRAPTSGTRDPWEPWGYCVVRRA